MPHLYSDGRGLLAAVIICLSLGQAVAIGIGAFATRFVFTALHTGPDQTALSELGSQTLIALGGLAASGCLYAVLRLWTQTIAEKLGQTYAAAFRQAFYQHMSLLPKSYVQSRRTGALGLRFVGDLSTMRAWASQGITGIAAGVIILPTGVSVLWLLAPIYGVISSGFAVFSLAVMWAYGQRLRGTHTSMRKVRAKISIEMIERVRLAPDLRIFGRLKADKKLLDQRGHDLISEATLRRKQTETMRAIGDIGLCLTAVCVLWATFAHGHPPSLAAAGLAVLSILALPLRDLAVAWDQYCAWKIASAKSKAIFDRPTHLKKSSETPALESPIHIHFDTVHVSEDHFLTGFVTGNQSAKLNAPEAETQFILNALMGLEPISTGQIRLNGLSVSDMDTHSIVVHMQMLSIDAPILQGSIRKNVCFGCKKRPSDEHIHAVLKRCALDTFVQINGGLTGRITSGGTNMTVQEKIRLNLARAMLADSSVLLIDLCAKTLDETTSRVAQAYFAQSECTKIFTSKAASLAPVSTAKLDLEYLDTKMIA